MSASARRSPVLAGAGERGLCAGGDVVAIYHSAKADGADAGAGPHHGADRRTESEDHRQRTTAK